MYQWLRIEPDDKWHSGTEDIALDFHVPPSHTHTCTRKQRACQERRFHTIWFGKVSKFHHSTPILRAKGYFEPTLKSVLFTCSKTKAGVRDWREKKRGLHFNSSNSILTTTASKTFRISITFLNNFRPEKQKFQNPWLLQNTTTVGTLGNSHIIFSKVS